MRENAHNARRTPSQGHAIHKINLLIVSNIVLKSQIAGCRPMKQQELRKLDI